MFTIDRVADKRTKNFLLTGYEHKKLHGFFRAKVIINTEIGDEKGGEDRDLDKGKRAGRAELSGRIGVWVPALMRDIPEDSYIYAYPCFPLASQNRGETVNDCVYGSNEGLEALEVEHKEQPMQGSEVGKNVNCKRTDEPVYDDYGVFLVPPVNSFVYVFFEDGDPNRCRYLPFGPTHIKDTTINEVKNKPCPEKEFYLLKTPHGHRVFVSDNDDRIMLRTYRNLFLEINEHDQDQYIELWVPVETPPRPFSSDAGPIGKGNEATEDENGNERKNEENKDLYNSTDNPIGGGKGGTDGTRGDHGGPKATIVCKGGNGIRGPERTDWDGKKEIGSGDPKDREDYLGIDRFDPKRDNQSDDDGEMPHPKGKKQEGNPLPGYRFEICSHEDKKYIQMETPSKYFIYLNEHEDDKFIKVQTENKNRIELNEHEDRKYIQVETENGYRFYMNYHDDDKFIKLMTSDKDYRLELNEHDDKQYIQLEIAQKMALYLNNHDDDQFIKLITDKNYWFEINQHDDNRYIELKTQDDYKLKLNEHPDVKTITLTTPTEFYLELSDHDSKKRILLKTPNGKEIILDDRTNDVLIKGNNGNYLLFNLDTGEVSLQASNKITITSPEVVVQSNNIQLGGVGGAKVITENSPCPFTGSNHTGGATTTSAI